jgi:hypothetical protein
MRTLKQNIEKTDLNRKVPKARSGAPVKSTILTTNELLSSSFINNPDIF